MFNRLYFLRRLFPGKNSQFSSCRKLSICLNVKQQKEDPWQTGKSYGSSENTNAAQTNFINVLKNYGFVESDCLKVISADPDVLTILPSDLAHILSRWSSTKLGFEYVHLLILNNPLFLYASAVLVEKRLPLLQAYVKKPKDLLLLLLRCPNLLTEQWEQIQAKIDYLNNVMRVEHAEILQSSALNQTLDHIKLRHNLLLKCGLYETPSAYEHKRTKTEKAALRNPHLKRIVDNEDISFARKICNITIEEYEAYCQVFEEQMEAIAKEEYISDSDSDDDSN